MLGLDRDSVLVVPYCDSWKSEFEKEKLLLQQYLKGIAIRIEHVGSTSIPGLSAKPIIDIAVGVKDKDALTKSIVIMQQYGYEVKDSIEEKEEVLAHRGTPDNRTHHVHIMINDNDRCINQILFRDYLLAHPQEIKIYQKLKLDLAKKYSTQRVMYTSSKNDYIQQILQKARQELL